MDSRLSIDLFINGKKIHVNIACMNASAKSEIEALLLKPNLDVKDILKAYIQKTQAYAELEEEIKNLTYKLE